MYKEIFLCFVERNHQEVTQYIMRYWIESYFGLRQVRTGGPFFSLLFCLLRYLSVAWVTYTYCTCAADVTYNQLITKVSVSLPLFISLSVCVCACVRMLYIFVFVLNAVSIVSRLYIGGWVFQALFIMFSCVGTNPFFKSSWLGSEVRNILLQRT